jgi:hypothetical protein
MKNLLLGLLLAFCAVVNPAFAQKVVNSNVTQPPVIKQPIILNGLQNPLNLPLLTASQAANMFTFIGSIGIPDGSNPTYGGVVSPGGALSVSGNIAFIAGHACNPTVNFCNSYAGGIAEMSLPTPCTGYIPNSNCMANVISPPQLPGVTYIKNYTLTQAPVAGDTQATFVSLPPNISANNGWYIEFNGSTTYDEVTGISGKTVSWATPLPAGTYSSTVPVYQWNPSDPWCTIGCTFGGTMVENGKLYVDAAATYDNGGGTTGWIVQSTLPITGTGWGAINVPLLNGTPNAEYSRSLNGPIYQTPPEWAPYFGQDFSSSGNGLSIVSNNIPQGPSYQAFNITDITQQGANTPIFPILLYTVSNNTLTNANDFSGPFPICTQTNSCSPSASGYPATLSSTPTAGDISETIALPSGTVTAIANISTTSDVPNATITSITSGTLSNSGIAYTVTDTGGAFPSGTSFNPSYSYAPGSTLGPGVYPMGVPSKAVNNDILTLTPNGYQRAPAWTMTFSDGEKRIGTISGSTFTFSPALTGNSSKAVTLAPMGNKWNTDYDGPVGTGFWVPGTSTFISIYYHKDGPPRTRTVADPCGGANASTSFFALAPDKGEYGQVLMLLYNANDLYKQVSNPGAYPPSTALPYATVEFPDETHLFNSSGCGTVGSYQNSWASFDYTNNTLYVAPGNADLYEYKLTIQ